MSLRIDLPPAFDLVALDTVESTNDEARRLADAGAPEGTLVWARSQTGGRGRRGRRFVSPPGNLYMSLVLRPDCRLQTAAELSFVTALAVGSAIGGMLPPLSEVRYKWPNDVLVGGRKISGILLESSSNRSGGVDWLVVGVGINVATFPTDIDVAATSLHFEGAADASPEAVLERFARQFMRWAAAWREEGFDPVRRAWWASAESRDRQVTVLRGDDRVTGRLVDLDPIGAIVLETPRGRVSITAGEVMLAEATGAEG